MAWNLLGPGTWLPLVVVAAGGFGRLMKFIWKSMAAWLLPWLVVAFAFLIVGGDQLLGGAKAPQAGAAALYALITGASAVGFHELAKKLLERFLGAAMAETILGKLESLAKSPSSPAKPLVTMLAACIAVVQCASFVACLTVVTACGMAVALPGCAGLLPVLEQLAKGASFLSGAVDLADDGQEKWFARNPNQDAQAQVTTALIRARDAVAVLESLSGTAKAADVGQVAAAKAEAVQAYTALHKLLGDLGVLSGTPAIGGAETEAPRPGPVALPTPAEVAAKLGHTP